MAAYGWSLDGSNTGFSLSGWGTRPVYFASTSDPVMTVNCTDEDGPGTCRGTNLLDVNGAHIHVPAGAQPDGNWDAHMVVIETGTDTEYDFWHVSISGSTLTAGAGAEVSLNGSNGTGSAGDAADFALTAGLLRPSELASGHIDHALVVTVPCTNATGANVGYSYPALGGWGEYCGQYWNESAASAPMLGQRFQLNMTSAQIAESGAPAWEQTIMTALANYGAYIEDTNGSWHNEGMDIVTQDPTSWTSIGQTNQWSSVVNALGGSNSILSSNVPIPISKLQLVSTCVTQGTCPSASGTSASGSSSNSSTASASNGTPVSASTQTAPIGTTAASMTSAPTSNVPANLTATDPTTIALTPSRGTGVHKKRSTRVGNRIVHTRRKAKRRSGRISHPIHRRAGHSSRTPDRHPS